MNARCFRLLAQVSFTVALLTGLLLLTGVAACTTKGPPTTGMATTDADCIQTIGKGMTACDTKSARFSGCVPTFIGERCNLTLKNCICRPSQQNPALCKCVKS